MTSAWKNSLLLMLLSGACCMGAARFMDSNTPYSIVYPVRVDRLGNKVSKNDFKPDAPSTDPRTEEHNFLNAQDGDSEYNRIRTDSFGANSKLRRKRQTFIEIDDEIHNQESNRINEANTNPRGTKNSKGNPGSPETNTDEEVFVRIENADEDLFLQLRPNRHLLTRGTVVEWVLPGGATVLKAAPDDCYLVGRSVGEEESSLVAVSSCSGLTGLIQTSRNSYFIEPLSSSNADMGDQNSSHSEDFIRRYRNRTKQNNQERWLESNNFFESDTANDNRAYQYQRSSQEIFTLPEPHVIYKVNTILERLNISLHHDQKFGWEDSDPNVSRRQKRSNKTVPNSRQGRTKERKGSRSGRKNKGRGSKKGRRAGKKNLKGGDTESQQRRRNRRHNREIRQRCRNRNIIDDSGVDGGGRDRRNVNSGVPVDEELEALCAQEQERRMKRREEKEKRRLEREEKLKRREERRQAREQRKRERQERRRNRRGRKTDVDVNANITTTTPWPILNLTREEWLGGYSPDLSWEIAQPAHSPIVVEEDLSGADGGPGGAPRNRTSPQRWLEVTVAVDSSVIDFHGEDNTEQYVFTLFNIVSAIYQDPSLGANLQLVLLRLICYTDAQQSQVRAGEAKASLEAVNRWASRLHHASQAPLRHDMAVWLTRHPLGGPSGYAPVGGVCHPSRSCTLNRDEGLTSAFIIAHEMGHVLGLSHDGDSSSSNACTLEGGFGSVMAPLVAATFTSFHWSRCSRAEYFDLVSSWHCMDSPPSWVNATTVSSVVSYHYSLDDQCRMEFGEGFGLCHSFGLSDSCTHLWCANASSPHLCKTKKGPPLEGTVCGEGKWCRYGLCTSRGGAYHPVDREGPSGGADTPDGSRRTPTEGSSPVRHNPQHGEWSQWTEWGPCSVTCGPGVAFRTRGCDNPTPRWGGRRCRGKREEWRVCAGGPCVQPEDARAAHCAHLAVIADLDPRRAALHWLPYEPKSRRHKCRVSCYSRATNEMFLGRESLRDGAPCSYDAPQHHICVQGKCVQLGCDLVAGSRAEEDECGVCQGVGDACTTRTDTYYGVPTKAYTVVTVLPKGARGISITEKEATTNFLALADRGLWQQGGNGSLLNESDFNLEEGTVLAGIPIEEAILLNPASKQGPARSFVSQGARFHYHQWGEREELTARGPLLYEVAVLIHGGNVESAVHVTSTYSIEKPPVAFHWKEGPFGPCSVTCGGGEQRTTLLCRNTVSEQASDHSNCQHLTQPTVETRFCNTFSCIVTWQPEPWEHCSATCGSAGVQFRVVSCVSLHQPSEPIDPAICPQDIRPRDTRPCNRLPCPAYWVQAGWTECSGECGRGGLQRALWRCPQEEDNESGTSIGVPSAFDPSGNDVTLDETEANLNTFLKPVLGNEVDINIKDNTIIRTMGTRAGILDDDNGVAKVGNYNLDDVEPIVFDCGPEPQIETRRCKVVCDFNELNTQHENEPFNENYNDIQPFENPGHEYELNNDRSQVEETNYLNDIDRDTRNKSNASPNQPNTKCFPGFSLSYCANTTNENLSNSALSNEQETKPIKPSHQEVFNSSRSLGSPLGPAKFPLHSLGVLNSTCAGDASKLCGLSTLQHYCRLPGYRKLCCFSCATSTKGGG